MAKRETVYVAHLLNTRCGWLPTLVLNAYQPGMEHQQVRVATFQDMKSGIQVAGILAALGKFYGSRITMGEIELDLRCNVEECDHCWTHSELVARGCGHTWF